jgi:hypothetical protein
MRWTRRPIEEEFASQEPKTSYTTKDTNKNNNDEARKWTGE